jgi:O-glycosyl hydrolase
MSREAWVDARPRQTVHGFGASGAWWPNDLARFPAGVRDRVASMLFDPDGLALTVYRYNVGGGGVGVRNPRHTAPTFLVEPGVYDWTCDPGGRLFLREAAARGVPVLVGFVNSAPAVWTTNGRCCGGGLRAGAEAQFARYLADVVVGLRELEGATMSYVSPMNEPDNGFPGCGQEGMRVPVWRRAAVVRAVAAELARRAPYARVVGDESSRVLAQLLPRAPVWLGARRGASAVDALVHHLYDFPGGPTLRAASLVGRAFRKPMWMTEICCVDSRTGRYGRQYDPTIAGAMPLANLVWQSMGVAGHVAFHWWVALSPEMGCDPLADPAAASRPNDLGWNDGLIYYDPGFAENGNWRLYPSKRYWTLANFSRFVRPGDVRHAVRGLPRGLRALAFRSPGGWAVVAINNGPACGDPAPLRLRLPSGRGAATAHETSPGRDLERVADPLLDSGGVLSATLAPQSVTTIVVGV